jgi:hypothetical protein
MSLPLLRSTALQFSTSRVVPILSKENMKKSLMSQGRIPRWKGWLVCFPSKERRKKKKDVEGEDSEEVVDFENEEASRETLAWMTDA